MDWAKICAAVIPCFNEAGRIVEVVQQLKPHVPTVLVVDDGSSDETSAIARKAGATVLSEAINLGKGKALRTGWRWARDHGFEWALALDGDGQHAPADVPLFFACAEKTGAELIVGNRMSDADRMPWLRRQVNRWMSRRISRALGNTIPDSQCGFRLMNLNAWSEIDLKTTRFEIESEVLVEFLRAGIEVEFVPIQVIYKDEQSKIHPCRDTVRWFRWWRRAATGAQRIKETRTLDALQR